MILILFHGQDGIIDEEGYVLNDITTDILIKQAVSHAEAGADIVAPSDMMDGRMLPYSSGIGRKWSYQYANYGVLRKIMRLNYYGPFRDAVGSAGNLKGGDKKTLST